MSANGGETIGRLFTGLLSTDEQVLLFVFFCRTCVYIGTEFNATSAQFSFEKAKDQQIQQDKPAIFK